MKKNHGWGGFKVYCWVFALVLLCGGTVQAQKVFDVGVKILSDRQMGVLSANMPQTLALAPVAGKASTKVPLAGVDLATTGVILVNEKTGRRVVLSGLSSRCSEIVLTPLLLAELKQSVLGEAETYTCLVVEKLAIDTPIVKRRYSVSASTDGVKCPVFNYGPKDNVKTTTLDQRRLIRISQRAPLYHPVDGSPETLAEIERLTEANKTYVYEYELPDGAIYTYQPSIAPLAVLETFTVGDFTVNLTYAFSTEQKTAIQFVLQAWSDQLAASIPIRFDLGFASLSGGTLAQASTSYTGSGGRTYPFSVYNHIMGYDAYPSDPDFSVTFNSNYSFSYGTSGSCPAGFTDFVTVFLHEVAHGLGFAGAMNSDGSYLIAGWPSKWEEYLYYNGSTLNTMTDSGRYTAIRSTALYWDGPNAKAANGGSQIEMYAPSTYASGSSVSHWDSSAAFTTFMKYSVAAGTYCRTINDREAKLLKDVGWTLTGAAPPAAPTGVLAGDGASTASVAVSWTASSGATGYDVYRYTSNNSGSASLLGSDIATTSYTDSTATPGVIYYYWVKAKNASGSSAFSASDSGYRALSAPTGVSATDTAPSAVTVTWSATSGASYYQVYRATSAGGTKTALGSWQTSLTYADSSAVVGTTYYYFVAAAVDGAGTRFSAYSAYDTGVRPAGGVTLGTALDNTSLTWTTGGDIGWGAQTVTTHDGVDAAQSGAIGDSQNTWIQTTVTGPGTLYYWWTVSSETGWDYLSFYCDGFLQAGRISGTSGGWTQQGWTLSAGTHTLVWKYEKDSIDTYGSDCGWVDQVVWTPSGGSTTTTEVPVPYTWLDSYLVVSGGNYEAAALADADGDGHLTWQEYVAGTIPTNKASVFKAGIDIVNGVRTLTWTPNLGASRTYTVEGKALITGAAWSSPTNAATRFFRVKVAVP